MHRSLEDGGYDSGPTATSRCIREHAPAEVDGFTDPRRQRPDLGERKLIGGIGHASGMIKLLEAVRGFRSGLFVPKPSS